MNHRLRRLNAAFFVILAILVTVPLFAQDIPLQNWTVPSASSSTPGRLVPTTNTEISNSAIFIALAPCRLVDTRNAAGAYGGPPFSAGLTRNFSVSAATTCTGIPSAAAYSMNFTLVNYDASLGQAGFVTAFPTGGTRPNVSTVNFGNGTNAVANAAVVPANGGSISVFSSGVTNLIIDINGYFMDNRTLPTNDVMYFLGSVSSSLGLFFVNNLDNTGLTTAVQGYLQSNVQNGSAAVKGNAPGATGETFGVQGVNASTAAHAAGVIGSASSPAFSNTTLFITSGVFGAAGAAGLGVQVGVAGLGAGRGVTGYQCNPTCGSGGIVGVSSTVGLHSFGDITAGGTKSFVEPHPTDASKQIVYIAMEGGEAGTYFRGRGRLAGGHAVIVVPEDFRLVTEEEGLTVQITPIGRMAQVGVTNVSLDTIAIEGSRDVEFSYLVQGVRRGFADRQPIQENTIFVPSSPNARMEEWPEYIKQTLVKLAVYNPDGSVNMSTAERMGWTKVWEKQAQEAARQQK